MPLILRFAWTGGTKDVAVNLPVGAPTVLVTDNLENGTLLWKLTAPWGLTTAYSHSPTHSLTDSPSGSYANNSNRSAQLLNTLDLTNFGLPTLAFWTRHVTEAGYDFCIVEASTDGVVWQTLASYSGSQTDWVQKIIPLAAFVGQTQLRLRFRLQSDGSVTADGWYLDDVVVSGYPIPANAAPTAPVEIAPVAGVTVTNPVFTVLNATDPDGPAPLTYGLRIYSDPLFTLPVLTQTGQAEGSRPDDLERPGRRARRRHLVLARLGRRHGAARAAQFRRSVRPRHADRCRRRRSRPAWLAATRTGGGTTFRFAVPRAGRATLTLYNLRGERVAIVFSGDVTGEAAAIWNQRDETGAPVASGLYLARLNGPDAELSLKLLVVR